MGKQFSPEVLKTYFKYRMAPIKQNFDRSKRLVLEPGAVDINDIATVGGINASPAEMIQNLSSSGIGISNGFVITAVAYRKFLEYNNLQSAMGEVINSIDYDNLESLRKGSLEARHLLINGRFPKETNEVIIRAYEKLSSDYGRKFIDVEVRSYVTAEDLPDASFAGQQQTFLNVRGPFSLMDAIRNCFASLFTDRAISYRAALGYDHFSIGLSVCVQKMVRNDRGS